MIILGLAGAAGSGKDTVADYLVERYGFIKFAFSDALYREVMEAWNVVDDSWLRDRANKETPSAHFALEHCADEDFVELATALMDKAHRDLGIDPYLLPSKQPLSPRQVLQWWGTEYRRAQDSEYWIRQAERWVTAVRSAMPYPEQAPQYFVNTAVRFPNERAWIHAMGGNVWHLRRAGLAAVNAHVSEEPLEVWGGERELHNNDTVERLHRCGVELLLTTNAKFVKVEPMLPVTQPE